MLIFIAKLFLSILSILLGIVILLLLIPVGFRFQGDFSEEEKKITVTVALFYGVIRLFMDFDFHVLRLQLGFACVRLTVYHKAPGDLGSRKSKRKVKTDSEKSEKPQKAGLHATDWVYLARRLLPRLLKPIRFKTLQGDLSLGFSNPATTGMVYGIYSMLKYRFRNWEKITLRANFVQPGIRGEILSAGVIYLHQYISILIFSYKQYRRLLRNRKDGK